MVGCNFKVFEVGFGMVWGLLSFLSLVATSASNVCACVCFRVSKSDSF